MYKIGELSKLSKIPVKTLRYYDAMGLLPPDYIDKFTGYRYYSAAKLSDCYRILALKETGFTLEEIRVQFSLPKDKLSALIAAKVQELCELQQQTEQRIHILRELQSAMKEDKSMFDIVIRKSDEIRLAFLRRTIPDRENYAGILEEIRKQLPPGLIGSRTVIIDYETEFRGQCFDTGFGIEITGRMPESCGLSEKIIRFTDETASLICTDEDYDKAVLVLHRYAEEHDYQIVGAVYKITYEDGTVEIKMPVVPLHQFDKSRNEALDVPFENDARVIGRWEFLDCLPCREMFNPDRRKTDASTWCVKELYFLPGGERYWCFGWTKGCLLSCCGYLERQSRNPYTIEETADGTFLFIEFKAYSYFKGGKPEIWVFRQLDARAYTKEEIMIKDAIPDIPADDARVLGVWNVCDIVRHVEDFDPAQYPAFVPYEDLFWRTAEFLEGGTMRNTFKRDETVEYLENGSVRNSFIKDDADGTVTDPPHVWNWVTGNVIQNPRSAVSMYKIRKLGDTDYLFIQWKNGDYTYGGEEPFWYVFQR